jgi:hypothetical protein
MFETSFRPPSGRLRQRDRVVSVPFRLAQAADLRTQTLRDRETGGVVRRGRDTKTGSQPLEVALEPTRDLRQVLLRGERRNVVVDAKCHCLLSPFSRQLTRRCRPESGHSK